MGVLGSDGSPQHFDRRWPSWILRNMKNSFAGLFLGSSSMSMPNFVGIRWTGAKCQAKMWNFPSSASPSASPLALREKAVHRASHFPVGAKNHAMRSRIINETSAPQAEFFENLTLQSLILVTFDDIFGSKKLQGGFKPPNPPLRTPLTAPKTRSEFGAPPGAYPGLFQGGLRTPSRLEPPYFEMQYFCK